MVTLMADDRDPLLVERGRTHGSFALNAHFSQQLKSIFQCDAGGYATMKVEHREALDMIALKLSRILSGQAEYADHWKDIGGYSNLAVEACEDK